MTLGQRIAQKRKELGLSQEALGEQLGVSRQAIYKWESDASLPEIEKLVTISRIFSVPVGWLLGVEEDAAPRTGGNLTEDQLAMVQQIVDQYLAAQPKPTPPKRRLVFKVAVGAACLCLAWGLWDMSNELQRVSRDYNALQNSIGSLRNNVNDQIGSIAGRVEHILKSQNQLTAEWDTQHTATDPANNTATFSIKAVPKTYVEGMDALLVAQFGTETVEQPAQLGADHSFTGELVCPLTDQEIRLSVVFLTGDKRETQLLDSYGGLYSASFPGVTLAPWPLQWEVEDCVLPATDRSQHEPLKLELSDDAPYDSPYSPVFDPETMELRVGLFRDNKLVMWYEERPYEFNLNGQQTTEDRWFRPRDITLEPGHQYAQAAVLTDQYGRQVVYPDAPIIYHPGSQSWEHPSMYSLDGSLEKWEF